MFALTKNFIIPGLSKIGNVCHTLQYDKSIYFTSHKDAMISKLARIMGLECTVDPDPSYVLTVDNFIKILAIQMRFR